MKQTENSHMAEKIAIRELALPKKKIIRVLDCFSADGLLWKQIKDRNPEKDIRTLRIEMKAEKKGVYLQGDNLKFISGMDLSKFDLIDLDAFGSPYKQLEVLFRREYKGPVVCTFIQTMVGALDRDMLSVIGYPRTMVTKAPTLFYRDGQAKMEAYLAIRGIKTITGYHINRKNYFYFIIS